MPFIMQPARIPAGGVFEIRGTEYATGQTFLRGEILVPEAGDTGNVVVGGVNPSQIVGVSLQAADTAPGFAAANNPATITGRLQKVSTCIANDQTVFQANLTNGSSTIVVPAATDKLMQYGVTAYSGQWTVDKAKTGAAARVTVVGIDSIRSIVFFRFLSSAIAGF